MNSYRKIASRKNKRQKTTRKSLKISRMLKNKQKKLTLNNKFRKRYQIGCSKKKYMKGGGISPLQAFSDVINNVEIASSSALNTLTGSPLHPSADPTIHTN